MEKVTDVKSVLRAGLKLYMALDGSSFDSMTADIAAVTHSGFAITIPVKDGFFHPLNVNTTLDAYFYAGAGKYFLTTTVKNRIFLENQPVLVLDMPKVLVRTERREFYRIDTLFPVKIIMADLVGEGELQRVEINEFKAHCVDISGGGLSLDYSSSLILPIKTGGEFDIDFCEAIPGLSRVRGIGMRKPSNNVGWGIKFTKITDSDRDKIIRYVFRKQFSEKQLER